MGQDDARSSLNAAINALDLAKEATSTSPAGDAFGSARALLTTVRDSTSDRPNYVELGLTCANTCQALKRAMSGKQTSQPSQPTLKAIGELESSATEIQRRMIKWGKRNVVSRRLHAKDDEEAIAAWILNLKKIHHVFENELAKSTEADVPDNQNGLSNAHTADPDPPPDRLETRGDTDRQGRAPYARAPGDSPPLVPRTIPGSGFNGPRDALKTRTAISRVQRGVEEIQQILQIRESENDQNRTTQNRSADRLSGELPPPPPRIFFGRDRIIEEVVRSSERLTPTALIGVGGIGKTSIALTVLHDNRIKQRFGDHRRFIRCDQFPPLLTHFLRRLSEVIGASIENPEDLTSLRPFLSSKEILIVLDNVESMLDPRGPNASDIYSAIEELGEFSNISLLITSRISIIPPNYETLEVPTLSMEAARDTFYRVYKRGEQSDLANGILKKLDFHPLSITLLATVAHQSKWSISRLTKEWEKRRTSLLQTEHNKSLSATIELSLASPTFQNLGPYAREFLGVAAFYPQGVDEKNLDWFFPTIPDRAEIFDKFCVLSLTHRSEDFITMLAPLRDYLSPKDPLSSPLLCMTRDRYFSRLLGPFDPSGQNFGETRWIVSEDVNVERLLDVLTSIDPYAEDVWRVCRQFMVHLSFHKPRLIVLGPKIEQLPGNHPLKPHLLSNLVGLGVATGNLSEYNRLVPEASKLWRDTGDPCCGIIASLASIKSQLTLKGRTLCARMMLGIAAELKHTTGHIICLLDLAELLYQDNRFDAASKYASDAFALLPGNAPQHVTYRCHYALGVIHLSKGTTEKAIEHLQVALGLVSSCGGDKEAFRGHYFLAAAFLGEERFDAANTHIEQAKRRAPDNISFAQATALQVRIFGGEGRFEEAASEVSRATDVFQELGLPSYSEVVEMFQTLLKDFLDESDPNAPNQEPGDTTSPVNDHAHSPDHNSDSLYLEILDVD